MLEVKNHHCISQLSMRGVIRQFFGPYFTVQGAGFESFLSRAPDLPQRYNKYLTNLVYSVCTVCYESSFFPLIYDTSAKMYGKKLGTQLTVRTEKTRLVRGMYARNYVFTLHSLIVFCAGITVQPFYPLTF